MLTGVLQVALCHPHAVLLQHFGVASCSRCDWLTFLCWLLPGLGLWAVHWPVAYVMGQTYCLGRKFPRLCGRVVTLLEWRAPLDSLCSVAVVGRGPLL
jgi:hypothetical protein